MTRLENRRNRQALSLVLYARIDVRFCSTLVVCFDFHAEDNVIYIYKLFEYTLTYHNLNSLCH